MTRSSGPAGEAGLSLRRTGGLTGPDRHRSRHPRSPATRWTGRCASASTTSSHATSHRWSP